MKEYKHQCVEKVYPNDKWGFAHGYRCSRDGSVQRDGKWYCKTHDPVAKQQRLDTKMSEWRKRSDREYDRFHRQNAEHKACEGIPTKALEKGVIQEMIVFCKFADGASPFCEGFQEKVISILAKLADKES